VPWRLTVRIGSRVEHARYDSLEQALDEIEARGRELARSTTRKTVDAKFKRFDPIQQVAARIELAGPQRLVPSTRAGVDVRGDGSTEAYLGGIRRRIIEQRDGESAYGALRRAVTDAAARA
jgi:hypothetical protein